MSNLYEINEALCHSRKQEKYDTIEKLFVEIRLGNRERAVLPMQTYRTSIYPYSENKLPANAPEACFYFCAK